MRLSIPWIPSVWSWGVLPNGSPELAALVQVVSYIGLSSCMPRMGIFLLCSDEKMAYTER